jgi:hypothetical protein
MNILHKTDRGRDLVLKHPVQIRRLLAVRIEADMRCDVRALWDKPENHISSLTKIQIVLS